MYATYSRTGLDISVIHQISIVCWRLEAHQEGQNQRWQGTCHSSIHVFGFERWCQRKVEDRRVLGQCLPGQSIQLRFQEAFRRKFISGNQVPPPSSGRTVTPLNAPLDSTGNMKENVFYLIALHNSVPLITNLYFKKGRWDSEFRSVSCQLILYK